MLLYLIANSSPVYAQKSSVFKLKNQWN